MPSDPSPPAPPLALISSCQPPIQSRAWHTTPHPYLPLLSTSCADKTVRIYSLTSFTLLSTITGGHKRSVRCSAWKPGIKGDKESVLATGSFDAAAGIWRCDNERHRVGTEGEDADLTRRGADQDGDDDVDEEDDEDYRFAVILEGHESEIKSLAWSAHGTYLATCSRDKSVWIWESLTESADAGAGRLGFSGGDDDDDNLETVAVLQEHEGDVKSVAWHPSDETTLASGSYDDVVRVWRSDADGEFGCVAVCEGHEGTVWCVCWEPDEARGSIEEMDMEGVEGAGANEQRVSRDHETDDETQGMESGPRIISSSDDRTVRVWRRKPKPKPKINAGPRIPSIIRSSSDEEEWSEEGQLPQRHGRAIYAVDWSRISRRVVTCGGDGKIVVYQEEVDSGAASGTSKPAERTEDEHQKANSRSGDVAMTNGDTAGARASEWSAIAELEAAHGVYEVNHVCWARRSDRHKRFDHEEVIVSTGDDGEVKVWEVP